MIYLTSSKDISTINLWRINKNTFSILQYGKFTPLMIGSNYTIANRKLVSCFDELLSDEIEISPIKIIRKATDEEWDGFYELIIKEHINPEKIKIIDEYERNIWQYNHYLFVSELFRNKLESEFEGKLKFSLGFSQFG